ncbi:MAG: DUF2202 domain-containing protein [Hydrogenophilales bacterium]|nr:DUF2202 domain-containing protein [Hydrogenophilales bacterium]
MKTRILIATLLLLASTGSIPAFAKGPNGPATPPAAVSRTVSVAPLSAEDAADLIWMREEEKVARDVYLTLGKTWNKPVFKRIAASEQRHFDALGAKLAQYGLADPALPTVGQFNNPELQAMYTQLVATGKTSYVAALTVGATIEDVDIADLLAAIEATENSALDRTYQNLLEGSKNHMRAFVELLRDLDADYAPQYIDPILFDAILGD